MVIFSQDVDDRRMSVSPFNHIESFVNKLNGNGIKVLAKVRLPAYNIAVCVAHLFRNSLHNLSASDSALVGLACGVYYVGSKVEQEVVCDAEKNTVDRFVDINSAKLSGRVLWNLSGMRWCNRVAAAYDSLIHLGAHFRFGQLVELPLVDVLANSLVNGVCPAFFLKEHLEDFIVCHRHD